MTSAAIGPSTGEWEPTLHCVTCSAENKTAILPFQEQRIQAAAPQKLSGENIYSDIDQQHRTLLLDVAQRRRHLRRQS